MKTLQHFIIEAADARRNPEAFRPTRKTHVAKNPLYMNVRQQTSFPLEFSRRLGAGVQSIAFDKEDRNDHDILLRTHFKNLASHDTKSMYLDYAMKHAHENPHLPRIKAEKTFVTDAKNPNKNPTRITHHVMERLHPIHSLSDEERKSMWHHAFGEEPLDNAHIDAIHFTSAIVAHLNSNVHPSNPKPNEHIMKILHQANHVVNKAKRKDPNGFHFIDLNSGNVMARKTPYGHQLVITDPVASFPEHKQGD